MQHQLVSSQLKITINSFGAEVCSVKNKQDLEFIWQANPLVWARHAPVLFPIVGKLKNNFFIYENKNYELPQHGFARDMEFDIITKNHKSVKGADSPLEKGGGGIDSCTFQLKSTEQTKNKYPFDFMFQIKYILEGNKLTTSYKIINPSNENIFFSVGAHPGFNCPLLPTEKWEDYYLEFEKNIYSQRQLNNGLRTSAKTNLNLKDQKLYLSKELFDNDALVFENNQINKISLCSSKSNHKITLECFNWPYFGVWSKKGNAAFVCLEPWYGIADRETTTGDFTHKEGVIKLASKQEFSASFSLIFT